MAIDPQTWPGNRCARCGEANEQIALREENARLWEYVKAREVIATVGILNASKAQMDRVIAAREALAGGE